MPIPKSYLTSSKNLAAILEALTTAQAPKKFTQRFLESLEFKSNSDRLIIGVLKSLDFLNEDGTPTEKYYKYLDQTQSKIVLAEGIRDAYSDLFEVNINAHQLSKPDVLNKLKTLSQGQYSQAVLDKMALTFVELCKIGDFDSAPAARDQPDQHDDQPVSLVGEQKNKMEVDNKKLDINNENFSLGGLHYNIQIVLPESRDPKVYDALFRSLKEHLS